MVSAVHCYGINLATGDAVEVGEAVGTIACLSGTWYTAYNAAFHTGGVASNTDITRGLRVQSLKRNPKGTSHLESQRKYSNRRRQLVPKVFVKGETGEGSTWYHSQPVCV